MKQFPIQHFYNMENTKVLILAMGCNQDFFIQEEKVVRKTYAKDILNNKYQNIDFWTFTASTDGKYHINKKIHKIAVPCDDSLYGTYDKNIKTFKVINEVLQLDYDYILHTNLSTFIHVPYLNDFIKSIPESDIQKHYIYSNKLYASKDGCGPEEFDIYGLGNSLLIPKFWVDVLIKYPVHSLKCYNKTQNPLTIDDNTFGFIINTYSDLHGIDKFDIWKQCGNHKNIFLVKPVREYINTDRTIEFQRMTEFYSTSNNTYYYEPNIYDILMQDQWVLCIDFSVNKGRSVPIHDFKKLRQTGKIYDVVNFNK